MKKLLPLLFLAATPFAAHAATSIAFSWTYASTLPSCSSTVTTNCLSGFTITDTTSGAVVATPSTAGASATSFTYTPAGGLYFGTHTFSLVANGVGATTTTSLTSTAVTTSVTNSLTTLAPPTGFSGSVQ